MTEQEHGTTHPVEDDHREDDHREDDHREDDHREDDHREDERSEVGRDDRPVDGYEALDEAAAPVEDSEAAAPVEDSQAAAPVEPGDAAAPVGGGEAADAVHPDEAAGSVDAADPAEPTEPAEPGESVEPVVLSGPASQRLGQLGLVLPQVPVPLAAYVPAVRTGTLVHTSGQLPFYDGVLTRTGVVGDEAVDVTPAEAAVLARQCALNAVAAVASVVDIDSVVRVVKVTGFVASAPGFGGQPVVLDGASTLLGQVFGDAGAHARSAVGVAALPLGAPVEVEIVVEVG